MEINLNTEGFKEIKDMDMKSICEIMSVIFKAMTLAVGVAVAVLSCLGSLDVQTAASLLGIGLACLALLIAFAADGILRPPFRTPIPY